MQTAIETLMDLLKDNKLKAVTAESCTGGLIAGAITDFAGASSIFERGFVTYSNEAKHDMLSVPMALFKTVGAVSPDVAEAMALGALKNSKGHVAVSCTGIAGPGGATEEKPVGLVYIGVAFGTVVTTYKHIFDGDRHAIRTQTIEKAFEHMITAIKTDIT